MVTESVAQPLSLPWTSFALAPLPGADASSSPLGGWAGVVLLFVLLGAIIGAAVLLQSRKVS